MSGPSSSCPTCLESEVLIFHAGQSVAIQDSMVVLTKGQNVQGLDRERWLGSNSTGTCRRMDSRWFGTSQQASHQAPHAEGV